MLRSAPLLATVSLVLLLGACGSGDSVGDKTLPAPTPVATIGGVGALPASASVERAPVIMVRPPVNDDGTTAELIGERSEGNRLLMIGDSILASTSSRYGNQMCDALVPLGWQVRVEAEPSRFIDFGSRVLDKVLLTDVAPAEDWNSAVVFLGSNYGGDPVTYEAELRKILDRLSPRPILLLTVTVYRPDWAEVNEVVNRLGAEYDNVTVLDWKSISDYPGVLSSDRLHPTETGRRVLADAVAGALGQISVGQGECLKSVFRDDSAVRGKPDNVLGKPSTGSSGGSPTTTTKPIPTTTTTVRSASPTTTIAGSSGGVTTTTAPLGGGGPNTSTTILAPATTLPSSTTQPTTTTTTLAPAGGLGDSGPTSATP